MNLRTTANRNRRFGSAAEYTAGWLDVGNGLQPVLLTDDELERILRRAEDNPEDVPQAGVWRNFLIWLAR